MRTQSIDTSPAAERVQIALLRQRGPARRFQLAVSLSRSVRIAALLARQHRHPGLTEQEAMFLSAAYSWGNVFTAELRQLAQQRQILPAFTTIDLVAAFLPVIRTLEQMGIPCALTGSFARSIYGMQQTHSQVDVLANLENIEASSLQELFPASLYARSTDIETALTEKTSFIYYHLPSLFSVRISFPRVSLDEATMLVRARRLALIENESALPVLAPEDIAVLALEEIRRAENDLKSRGRTEEPDALWNELLGVLKIQEPELDLQSIGQQARHLELLNLLQRSLQDAGLHL